MKRIKIFLLSTFYFLLSSPLSFAAGLVPCEGTGENACHWCDFFVLFKNIIDFMMKIIFPLAAIMIVWGGILMMTAGDKPDRFSQGRKVITAAVIGIVIALLSWLIIDTVFKYIAIGLNPSNFGFWHELSCS